jgi:hypothetical protein
MVFAWAQLGRTAVAAKVEVRWAAVVLAAPAVKVARAVAAKVVAKWVAAEKWEEAQGGPVAAVKVVGRWAAEALAVPAVKVDPAAACKIMQSLLKT